MHPDTRDPATDAGGEPLDPLDEGYTPPPKQASLWEDFVDVFFSPSELFARRRDAQWWLPLIVLLAFSLLIFILLLNANERMMMASIEQSNPEALAEMGENARTFMLVFGAVGMFIMLPLMAFWTAFLLWGVGKLFDARPTFRQAMVISVYASFVFLVAQLAMGLLVTLQGTGSLDPVSDLSFGVLRFMSEPGEMSGAIVALLQRVDLFAVWQAVLWGIGLRAMLGASRGQAFGVAGVVWVLFALPQVVLGAIGGAVTASAGG